MEEAVEQAVLGVRWRIGGRVQLELVLDESALVAHETNGERHGDEQHSGSEPFDSS